MNVFEAVLGLCAMFVAAVILLAFAVDVHDSIEAWWSRRRG